MQRKNLKDHNGQSAGKTKMENITKQILESSEAIRQISKDKDMVRSCIERTGDMANNAHIRSYHKIGEVTKCLYCRSCLTKSGYVKQLYAGTS